MKNPIKIVNINGKPHSIGDPFILRFDGKYYLYPSSSYEEPGVRCFVSDDLIRFIDKGLVANNEILRGAYAPEVILYNDKFYMCTSPCGNGHYLLQGDSPLGPFELISENIGNMIDGSFVIDENYKLRFLRADHNGITMHTIEDNKIINRIDLLPQVSGSWTEGPSITYNNGYYYATYCGNHLEASSYRIKLASSKEIDRNYKVQDDVLLLSTKKGYSHLGHNSLVLGPSLDEYYIAYHQLIPLKPHGHFRYLGLDRVYFNGSRASVNVSSFVQQKINKPTFKTYGQEKLINDENYLLTPRTTKERFVVEFNIKGNGKLIVSYKDKNDYYELDLFENTISLNRVLQNKVNKLINKQLMTNFNYFHSIRIINGDEVEVLVDNVPVLKGDKLPKGKIGYIDSNQKRFCLSYSNDAQGSSLKRVYKNIPGTLESIYINENKKTIDNFDGIKSVKLNNEEEISFKVLGDKEKEYIVSSNIKYQGSFEIEISSSLETKKVQFSDLCCDYEFLPLKLTTLKIAKKDILKIKVLKGKFEFKQFIVNEKDLSIPKNKIVKNATNLNTSKNSYYFTENSSSQELKFKIKDFTNNSLFGLIFNAKDYSSHNVNKHPSYQGYLVGFINNLLIVEHCQYGTIRIYDKPIALKKEQEYTLKVENIDSILNVYLDGKFLLKTPLNHFDVYGLSGIYKNKEAKVEILNYSSLKEHQR